MKWLDKIVKTPVVDTPPIESTRPELRKEQAKMDALHDRTDKLAKLLRDYNAQDQALR